MTNRLGILHKVNISGHTKLLEKVDQWCQLLFYSFHGIKLTMPTDYGLGQLIDDKKLLNRRALVHPTKNLFTAKVRKFDELNFHFGIQILMLPSIPQQHVTKHSNSSH